MITNHNRYDDRNETKKGDKESNRVHLLAAVTDGYLPDENDPAWPSRSGQGD